MINYHSKLERLITGIMILSTVPHSASGRAHSASHSVRAMDDRALAQPLPQQAGQVTLTPSVALGHRAAVTVPRFSQVFKKSSRDICILYIMEDEE